MLGERVPLIKAGNLCNTSATRNGFGEIDRCLAQYSNLTSDRFSDQFKYGEFVGNPETAINPERTEEEERELRLAADKALNDPRGAGAAYTQSMLGLIEKFIYVDSKPFKFISKEGAATYDRSYLKPLYDFCADYPIGCRNQIWHTGRQVEKSTTQSGKAITLGAMFPAYKSLYVAPRFDQVTVFSSQRFRPMAEDSPALTESLVRPSKTLWQVGAKEFTNRSFFNFRSCYMTADGCRGISAHHLMIDEIQDILSDNIPVLEECQSHYGWETGLRVRSYAGTPKTNNNPITRRYKQSCQFEWMTKCHACNHWNFPDEAIIGPTSYICIKCSKPIFPQQHGMWVPQNRAALDKCWGFRLPQMVVPFKTHADILEKKNDPNISRLKFYNECLGLSYDEGEVVLTENDLRAACEGNERMMSPEQIRILANNGVPIFAGLDHGTGEGDHPSYTVLSIGHFIPHSDTFIVRYIKKFVGKDSELVKQPEMISDICDRAGVRMMMADWGFGAYQNARMVSDFGWSWTQGKRILMQAMYVRQRDKSRFDSTSMKYLIDRNQAMIDCIDAIKRRLLQFFSYEDFQPFTNDFTTIYLEYNERYGTSKYDHVDPDDCFHAVNYALMAGQQYFGKLVKSALPDLQDVDPDDLGY